MIRVLFFVLLGFPMQACVAGVLPPSRSDIGTTIQQPDGELRTGLRISTGAHLASATLNKEEPYDVGIGYVYERAEASGKDVTMKAPVEGGAQGARTSQGVYLSAAHLLSLNLKEHHRTWLGMRAEYLHASEEDGGPSVSLLARGTWEIFGVGEGAGGFSDSCGGGAGFAYGTTALGVFLEGGARRSLEGEASVVATAGISVRLPFLGGLAYNVCGK